MKSKIINCRPPFAGKMTCQVIDKKNDIINYYRDYFKDESRLNGNAPKRIFFPRNTKETSQAMYFIHQAGEKVTISGGRTGISGGAVNIEAENIISLQNINKDPVVKYDENNKAWILEVGSGMLLSGIAETISKKKYKASEPLPGKYFFPVDPTEQSAQIGGACAANASGARTYFYGPMRSWVTGLTVVLADGSILKINRNTIFLTNGNIKIKIGNKIKEINIPQIKYPQTKNAAGYFLKPDMDIIDLFIGSEGTLGVITEVNCRLAPLFSHYCYLILFDHFGKNVSSFVSDLHNSKKLSPLAIEYMDQQSLLILRDFRKEYGSASHVPDIPADVINLFYLEFGYNDETDIFSIYKELKKTCSGTGISVEQSWAGFLQKDLNEMKLFRHALPERINSIIAERKKKLPELTKIGTDLAVPLDSLEHIINYYNKRLKEKNLEFVQFGHIGNGHLHVNILPENLKELRTAKELYKEFAAEAVKCGGSVSAEHGIGQMKKGFMSLQYTQAEIQAMKSVKDFFDVDNILNPGVLF